MTLPEIREQIKTVLAGVPGIGVVHDHERFVNDWNKFLALFQDSAGYINGVMFHREKQANRQETHGEVDQANVFLIRRFMGMQDGRDTGIIFDDHLDAMLDALLEPDELNAGTITTAPDWGPMAGAVGAQLEVSDVRMFGNVLCHYAELRLCVAQTIEK